MGTMHNPPDGIATIAANIAARVARRRQNTGVFTGSDSYPDPVNMPNTDPTDWQTNGDECHAIIDHNFQTG